MRDRIEKTYEAIDQMIKVHGTPRHEIFGGELWNAEEEFEIYKEQVGDRYSPLQWHCISTYFKLKLKTINLEEKEPLNLNWSPFAKRPKKLFLCYQNQRGEWRQAAEDLSLGSLGENPHPEIIGYAYFTKKEIKKMRIEE